jgi:hypothetical protein
MDMQTSPPNQPPKRLRPVFESLASRNENSQWEDFITRMLVKLELPKDKHDAAVKRYDELCLHVARRMGKGPEPADAHVVVQGSMRTQTTVAGDGREQFDLDIVVKLCGAEFEGLEHSDQFFKDFGAALHGIPGAGVPEAKNRCWRLEYVNEPFYFDVTPAIPLSEQIIGTDLRVRDKVKVWSPSNPQEFADWFCTIADKRFEFQRRMMKSALALDEARTTADPVPGSKVPLNDILRRLVQLMKLHRDGHYKNLPQERRDARPISVILVTLAAHAYDEMVTNERTSYSSALEVALEVIDRMPKFIERSEGKSYVFNPAMRGPKRGENFADRWNSGARLPEREFNHWHDQLVADLKALFSEEYTKRSENRIRAVFGEPGVKAWKESQPVWPDVLGGLLATTPSQPRTAPQGPRVSGSRDTLA